MIKSKIKTLMLKLYFNKRIISKTIRHENKNVKLKKHLFKNTVLTHEQKAEIDKIWLNNYGKKIPYHWHRLYQSYYNNSIGGGYDKYYFPEILFTSKLQHILNPPFIRRPLEDKGLIDLFFSDCGNINLPETIILNCSGYFYDGKRNFITRERAEELLKNAGDVFSKPTRNSNSGKNVFCLNFSGDMQTNSFKEPGELIDFYKEDFIVQKKIKQSAALAALHRESVNTFRVHTYILENVVYVTPTALRMGVGKNCVDNAHAGGISVAIHEDGRLGKVAFSEYQKTFYKHPDSNITFYNYLIPNFDKVINAAKLLHGRIPHVGIIGWDFTIDDNEIPVIIEANLSSSSIWFPQYTHGKGLFGDNTEKMIRLCKEGEIKL